MATEKRRPGRPRTRPVVERDPRGRRKPRPHVWKSGTDEYRHSMYMPWLKAKAQANYRGEGWTLTFDEFYEMWKDDWHNRGRLSHNVCMSRRDQEKPWTAENTYIRTRYEQLLEQAQLRLGIPYGPRKLK